ncbi:zinc-ribbon domain-containing protein [Acinetobacter sp. NS-4]|uniref:zinc-ribbon domain-containing protein n=1 Tax=Acinetobacter sp. NS-4 TaxID=3127956 RepID=UPI00307D90B4
MFFIFGIGPKTKVVEKSQFLCPVCRTRSAYELKQQCNYFSLFFIPLLPLSKSKGEFVKCLHCETEMPSTVLNHA